MHNKSIEESTALELAILMFIMNVKDGIITDFSDCLVAALRVKGEISEQEEKTWRLQKGLMSMI